MGNAEKYIRLRWPYFPGVKPVIKKSYALLLNEDAKKTKGIEKCKWKLRRADWLINHKLRFNYAALRNVQFRSPIGGFLIRKRMHRKNYLCLPFNTSTTSAKV
jgi:hypothetical protein